MTCGVYFCPMHFREDTIIAKATPPGEGALGVIRISGRESFRIAAELTRNTSGNLGSHEIRLRKFYTSEGQIDEGLIAMFRSPASFTGEDMVELYLHGSGFILSALMQYATELGCRMADPGEFTLRAYLNGKLDLAQAEAVADLIAAQSAGSHRLALNQLKGGVSHKIGELRRRLLEFAALVELELDFGEEDVEFADRSQLRSMLEGLKKEVGDLLATFKTGNAIKEGVPVAIVGKPNAGKSTLLNALLQEERAIVTDIPGTTRDTIEEYFLLDGIKFRLIDTAGIRESADVVESLGIQRTFESLSKAAIVLVLADASTELPEGSQELVRELSGKTEGEVWLVANKIDQGLQKGFENAICISAKDGRIDQLLEKLKLFSGKLLSEAGDITITSIRHSEVLARAQKEISHVIAAMDQKQSGDILAFELRNAMAELGKITGEIDSEDILGEIFGKFCIGK